MLSSPVFVKYCSTNQMRYRCSYEWDNLFRNNLHVSIERKKKRFMNQFLHYTKYVFWFFFSNPNIMFIWWLHEYLYVIIRCYRIRFAPLLFFYISIQISLIMKTKIMVSLAPPSHKNVLLNVKWCNNWWGFT